MNNEKKIDDGGSAFPVSGVYCHTGMSLRDWFAGQALAGLLADPECGGGSEAFCSTAYVMADAMLAERNKKTT